MSPTKRSQHSLVPTFSVAYLSKWGRVLSNISAGMLILGTGIVVMLLLNQGMFYSTIYYEEMQDTWTPFHTSCMLSPQGFVPMSCDAEDENVTGPSAWRSIGEQLAVDLMLNTTVFATTCVIGASEGNRSATFMIVMDDIGFPECKPKGPQKILGMAAIETVASEALPQGAFLMSTYADVRPRELMQLKETNGHVKTGFKSIVKTIVTVHGERAPTTWDQKNYVTYLNSLNRLFFMRVWLIAHYVDISDKVKELQGYSVGKYSGLAFTASWDNSHNVDNYMLLLLFQVLICFVSLSLLSNDGVITLEGLSGLLKNKPVLTYDILASLERRKVLLVSLVCTFFFSPLYADAIRYTYYVSGHHYWSLSLLMISVMMALSWIAILTCLQWLPVPSRLRNRPLVYSTPVFVYCTIVFILVSQAIKERGLQEADNFWDDCPSVLLLNIRGKLWLSGAYDLEGTTPVIYLLMPDIAVCIGAAWIASIIVQRLLIGYVVLDTTWTTHNGFLNFITMPQWVTGLDLDHRNTIAIGNKLYCKPSMIVLLGYCTVRNASKYVGTSTATQHSRESSSHETNKAESHLTSSKKGSKPTNTPIASPTSPTPSPSPAPAPSRNEYIVLSIYSLAPALLPWVSRWHLPSVIGVIASNRFEIARSTATLEKSQRYKYSRGDCCA